MKAMFESSETAEAYWKIDFYMFNLGRLLEGLGKPLRPIEKMVDAVTGYDPVLTAAENAVVCIREIIRNKKIIEADTVNDEEQLSNILRTFPELKQKP